MAGSASVARCLVGWPRRLPLLRSVVRGGIRLQASLHVYELEQALEAQTRLLQLVLGGILVLLRHGFAGARRVRRADRRQILVVLISRRVFVLFMKECLVDVHALMSPTGPLSECQMSHPKPTCSRSAPTAIAFSTPSAAGCSRAPLTSD